MSSPPPGPVATDRDGLRRHYRQGLILARCDYSDLVDPLTANTASPQLYFGHLPGALIAARNTAVGMLQNGYDIVSVLADKRLTPDGSVPFGNDQSFFGEKPTGLTPEEEAEETARATFAADSINSGRLLWVVAPKLPRADIAACIDTLEKMKPKVNGQVKGPAGPKTELTVCLIGHGVMNEEGDYAVAFNHIRLVPRNVGVRVFDGYTLAQLLDDLTLKTRWKHLLIIADTCTAGTALTKDSYVPDKAEMFLDDVWTLAYHTPSYQFIGSSLNGTQGLALLPWQGTVFSMAMDRVLWHSNPTAFQNPGGTTLYNWATVGHVGERLRESMNAIMEEFFPTDTDLAPTCLHGRLDLVHCNVTQPNEGHFLFVRHGAPAKWTRGDITQSPYHRTPTSATSIATTPHPLTQPTNSATLSRIPLSETLSILNHDWSRHILIVVPQLDSLRPDILAAHRCGLDEPFAPFQEWVGSDDYYCYSLYCHTLAISLTFILIVRAPSPDSCVARLALLWQPDLVEFYPVETGEKLPNRVVVVRNLITNPPQSTASHLPPSAFRRQRLSLGETTQRLGDLSLPSALSSLRVQPTTPDDTTVRINAFQDMGSCSCGCCARCGIRRVVILTTSAVSLTAAERVDLLYACAAASSRLLPVDKLTQSISCSKTVRFEALFRDLCSERLAKERDLLLLALRDTLWCNSCPSQDISALFRLHHHRPGADNSLQLHFEAPPSLLWSLLTPSVSALVDFGFDHICEPIPTSYLSVALRTRDATVTQPLSQAEMSDIADSVIRYFQSTPFSSRNATLARRFHASTASQTMFVTVQLPDVLSDKEYRPLCELLDGRVSLPAFRGRAVMSVRVVYEGEDEHVRSIAEDLSQYARSVPCPSSHSLLQEASVMYTLDDETVRRVALIDALRFDLVATVKVLALHMENDCRLIDIVTYNGDGAAAIAARHGASTTLAWLLSSECGVRRDVQQLFEAAFDGDSESVVEFMYDQCGLGRVLTSDTVKDLVGRKKFTVAAWVCTKLKLELTDFAVATLKSVMDTTLAAHRWSDWHAVLAQQYLKKATGLARAKALEHAKEALQFAFDDRRRLLPLRVLAELNEWDTIVKCFRSVIRRVHDREIRLIYACGLYWSGQGERALSHLLDFFSPNKLVDDHFDSVKPCDVLSLLSLALFGRAVLRHVPLSMKVFVLELIEEGLTDDMRQGCTQWLSGDKGSMSQLSWLDWTHQEQIALAAALRAGQDDWEALCVENATADVEGKSIVACQLALELSARVAQREHDANGVKGNILSMLSDGLHIDNLQVLDLSGALSGSFPACLLSNGVQQQLKILNLSNNQLRELPAALFQPAQQLLCLTLDNNQLTRLPTSLGCCTNLITLSVANNPLLSSLPESLIQLKYLREINLGGDVLLVDVQLSALARLYESLQILVMPHEEGMVDADPRLWCAEQASHARAKLDHLAHDLYTKAQRDGSLLIGIGMTVVIGGEGASGKTTFFRGMLGKDFVESHRKTWYASVSYCDSVVEREGEVSLVEHFSLGQPNGRVNKDGLAEQSWETSAVKRKLFLDAQRRIEQEEENEREPRVAEQRSAPLLTTDMLSDRSIGVEERREPVESEAEPSRASAPLVSAGSDSVGGDESSHNPNDTQPHSVPATISQSEVPSSAGDMDDDRLVSFFDGYGHVVAGARHARLPRLAFIDLGGQKEFRAVQSIIPFTSSLYIVVVDLEKLHATPTEEMSKLEKWFLLPAAKRALTVMVIGTHASSSGYNFDAVDSFAPVQESVSEMLRQHELRWWGDKPVWPVDYARDFRVDELRVEVLRAAKDVGEQVRSSSEMARAVDSVQVCVAPGALSVSREEVRRCLQAEHPQISFGGYVREAKRLGAAVFDPRVPDRVFVDVPGLVDAVGRVYSRVLEDKSVLSPVDPALAVDVDTLRDTGVWTEALVDWALGHTAVPDGESLKELLLKCQVPLALEDLQRGSGSVLVLSQFRFDFPAYSELMNHSGVIGSLIAKCFAERGYNTVVVCDEAPVDFDPATHKRLEWFTLPATRQNIRVAIAKLAEMNRAGGSTSAVHDELIVYMMCASVQPWEMDVYGACMGDATFDGTLYSGAYTLDMLRDDLDGGKGPDGRWGKTLVVLDTPYSASVFDAGMHPRVCERLGGSVMTAEAKELYSEESFQCLVAAGRYSSAYLTRDKRSTHLFRSLVGALTNPGVCFTTSDSSDAWLSIGACLASIREVNPIRDFGYDREAGYPIVLQSPELQRLPWHESTNTGEFLMFHEEWGIGARRIGAEFEHQFTMVPVLLHEVKNPAFIFRPLVPRADSPTSEPLCKWVSGPCGTGKTVWVAMSVRRSEQFKFVLWVNAESEVTIMQSFREGAWLCGFRHGVEFGESGDYQLGDRSVIEFMFEKLREHADWLLVVDGWDDDSVDTVWPENAFVNIKAGVIFTSCRRSIPLVISEAAERETVTTLEEAVTRDMLPSNTNPDVAQLLQESGLTSFAQSFATVMEWCLYEPVEQVNSLLREMRRGRNDTHHRDIIEHAREVCNSIASRPLRYAFRLGGEAAVLAVMRVVVMLRVPSVPVAFLRFAVTGDVPARIVEFDGACAALVEYHVLDETEDDATSGTHSFFIHPLVQRLCFPLVFEEAGSKDATVRQLRTHFEGDEVDEALARDWADRFAL